MARARDAFGRDRLGHALLIHAAAGLGGELLGAWLARLVLCDVNESRPCGRCPSCQLFEAGTHPDFARVGRLEDALQIKIEQIRELAEKLALKSYRGGYKVAVVTDADSMNVNAANALLKTLEEPSAATLLVLCSVRPSQLPATIVSRCHRLEVALPKRSEALEWLQQHKALDRWPELLAHAGGAPLRALELEAGGFLELDRDMSTVVERLGGGTLDVPGTAERWAKKDLELRLAWLDTWITERVHDAFAPPADLPSRGGIRNIRGLYALLDRVRALKIELGTSLNMQLATEELLVRAEAVLAA